MFILQDRVLVELEQSDEMTPSRLLFVPDEARDPSYTGIVKAIGPDNFDVRPGDRIVFSRYAGVPIAYTLAGRPLKVVLDRSEVLGVFDDAWQPTHRTVTVFTPSYLNDLLDLPGNIVAIRYDRETETIFVVTEEVGNAIAADSTNDYSLADALRSGRGLEVEE